MNEIIVPGFGRLTDYLGLWAIEPSAFTHLWEFAQQLDMRQHVASFVPDLASAVEMATGPNGQKIAVVKLTGLLMKSQSSLGGTSTIQARRDIRQAAADPDVAGIMLAIDSPGGTVAGTHDLAQEIKTARKMKPVWAHVEDLGASAAYWAASQAERVTANAPTAHIGSIGTFHVIHDHSGAAEKAGVRTLVFSTGPLKGMGAMGARVTDDQAAHVQNLVNTSQESFDAGVQTGRGLSADELAAVKHGGVMSAKSAMNAKLIDGVQPLGKTMAEFSAALKKGTTASYRQAMEAIGTGAYGIDLVSGELVAFTHNSETSASEPDWSAIDKTALPMLAFADHGDGENKSSWKYPHHWVQNAGGKDDKGVWTTGTLLLHRGGLNAAWSSAQGGRSGEKAPQAVVDHLEAHRRALGLDKPTSGAAGSFPMLALGGLPVLSATES